MQETVNETLSGQPELKRENLPPEKEDTTPNLEPENSTFVEVKFNKEIKKLNLSEAATMAQKGLKFDLIEADFKRLKELSNAEGLSVKEFINNLCAQKENEKLTELTKKCGGDAEMAKKVLEAEEPKSQNRREELFAEFPNLKAEDIPEEVKTAAELKGTGLLFEYLLYNHRQRVAANEEEIRQNMAQNQSLGSLSCGTKTTAADAEFLKGVWGR